MCYLTQDQINLLATLLGEEVFARTTQQDFAGAVLALDTLNAIRQPQVTEIEALLYTEGVA